MLFTANLFINKLRINENRIILTSKITKNKTISTMKQKQNNSNNETKNENKAIINIKIKTINF